MQRLISNDKQNLSFIKFYLFFFLSKKKNWQKKKKKKKNTKNVSSFDKKRYSFVSGIQYTNKQFRTFFKYNKNSSKFIKSYTSALGWCLGFSGSEYWPLITQTNPSCLWVRVLFRPHKGPAKYFSSQEVRCSGLPTYLTDSAQNKWNNLERS